MQVRNAKLAAFLINLKNGTGTSIPAEELAELNIIKEGTHEFTLLLQFLNGTLSIPKMMASDGRDLTALTLILRPYSKEEKILFPQTWYYF